MDPRVELLFIGSSHGPEGAIAEKAGMPFKAVPSSSLTRALSLKNAASLARLIAGVPRARRMLKAFGPDVVIGTGGYTTAAVLIAQRLLGGPVVIHEQNAIPGRTNLFLARIADRVCVTFDRSAGYFAASKVAVTGMPIRKEFAALPNKADARRELGLEEGLFTLLVVGGSQGARAVNQLIMEQIRELCGAGIQVLHQVGERNVQDVIAYLDLHYGNALDELPYHLRPYLDMPAAIAAADLVVARSGASTIAEITAAGLPSIMIPYPYAYANHQKHNARYLVERGAAVLCEEGSSTAIGLAGIILDLKRSPEKLRALSEASAALGRPDAARAVAEAALQLIAHKS